MAIIKTINLDTLPSNIRRFVDQTIETCKVHDIDFEMSPESSVRYFNQNSECAGYFSDDPRQFKCGCGGKIEEWFPTFIHETCHIDQWLEKEKNPIWNDSMIYNGIDSNAIIDMWLEHFIELTNKQVKTYIDCTRNIELDCEQRAVEKIKEWNFDIDIPTYIQQANGHVLSYNLLPITRRWSVVEEGQNEDYWAQMPKIFYDDSYYQLKPLENFNEWIWEEPYIHFRDLLISTKTV